MDAKITLSFDESVIKKAKRYADDKNISLSRLTEFLLSKVVANNNESLEELPISDWVNIVAEGEVEYKTSRNSKNKNLSAEYFKSKK
ncbi:MAG: hypothetical protein KA319_13005 [Ferruginibacter sp.]|nr:hypothetical protein [Ferruginibacter sp.]